MHTTQRKVEYYVQMLIFRYGITHWVPPYFSSFDKIYIQTDVSQAVPVSSIASCWNRGPNLKTTTLGLLVLSDSYRLTKKNWPTSEPKTITPVNYMDEDILLSPFQEGARWEGQNRECAKMCQSSQNFTLTVYRQYWCKRNSDNANDLRILFVTNFQVGSMGACVVA